MHGRRYRDPFSVIKFSRLIRRFMTGIQQKDCSY